MTNVGNLCDTLLGSAELISTLRAAGKTRQLPAGSVLFAAGDENAGVFVVDRGEVLLQVPHTPHLDRVFMEGSVLGLPSTFTGEPYRLKAVALTDVDLIQVEPKTFLQLMSTRVECCRHAMLLLSREITFILNAFRTTSPGTETGPMDGIYPTLP